MRGFSEAAASFFLHAPHDSACSIPAIPFILVNFQKEGLDRQTFTP
jgi:hypothetical protein